MSEPSKLLSCLPEEENQRLDLFISRLLVGVSRRDARRACEAGSIHLNGRKAAPGQRVKERDILSVFSTLGAVSARPELFSSGEYHLEDYIEVVYEDEHMLLLDKGAGIHSVTLTLDDPPTLADAIAAYEPRCLTASEDPREAGLVQRLDRPTRGLILAAKSARVWRALHAAFSRQEVTKTYLALVEGLVPSSGLSLSGELLARAERMQVKDTGEDAGEARLVWACESLGVSLVRVSCVRGQRHQVRAHLAHCGHPLLGDALYGSGEKFAAERFGVVGSSDFFLLASELEFVHPQSGERLMFSTKQDAAIRPE